MSVEAPVYDGTVRLLEYDPELAHDLRAERREEATRTALAHVLRVPRGPWTAEEIAATSACPYGLLVLDGLVSRTVLLGEDASTQLLGQGDLIRPASEDAGPLVPVDVRWTVLEPMTVALLDERFLLTVRRWPELVAALFERIAAQAVRLGTHRALCQLPRVEDRVHALMWFLAERWGRMTAQGVILPLKLTHQMLGQLVGAKRPTVTLAIKDLEQRGVVHRRADGAWLLEQRWTRTARDVELAHLSTVFVEDGNGNGKPRRGPVPSAIRSNGAGANGDGGHDDLLDASPTPSFTEIRLRIERIRNRHDRSKGEVDAVLARCAELQRHSILLRERIERSRRRIG